MIRDMMKSNIKIAWDSLETITSDIILFLQECEDVCGEEFKKEVIEAIIKATKD